MGLGPRTLKLQTLLEGALGSNEVHFQPPPNVEMKYPAIVYKRDRANTSFADNRPYRVTKRYQVTVISREVEDPVLEKIAALPTCTHERSFVAENLNHDVYNLFF